MKRKNQITGIICSMFLFAGSAQACYYEGDPVLTASGYDTPKTSSSSSCYYDGDPVMEKSGNYDSPAISYEAGDYYTADMPEKVTHNGSEENAEFSAFEADCGDADDSAINNASVDANKTNTNDEMEWIPQSWSF